MPSSESPELAARSVGAYSHHLFLFIKTFSMPCREGRSSHPSKETAAVTAAYPVLPLCRLNIYLLWYSEDCPVLQWGLSYPTVLQSGLSYFTTMTILYYNADYPTVPQWVSYCNTMRTILLYHNEDNPLLQWGLSYPTVLQWGLSYCNAIRTILLYYNEDIILYYNEGYPILQWGLSYCTTMRTMLYYNEHYPTVSRPQNMLYYKQVVLTQRERESASDIIPDPGHWCEWGPGRRRSKLTSQSTRGRCKQPAPQEWFTIAASVFRKGRGCLQPN